MTLTMKHSGKLRVAQGAAWVTFSNAASDATVRGGDHFLNAGQSLQIKLGQVLVIEALDAHVFFDFAFDRQNLAM